MPRMMEAREARSDKSHGSGRRIPAVSVSLVALDGLQSGHRAVPPVIENSTSTRLSETMGGPAHVWKKLRMASATTGSTPGPTSY